jgi:hypothetical protein
MPDDRTVERTNWVPTPEQMSEFEKRDLVHAIRNLVKGGAPVRRVPTLHSQETEAKALDIIRKGEVSQYL